MLWITVAVGLITASAAAVAYVSLRASTDPEVVLYTAADPHRPSLVLLVIENVGRGVALDVRFSLPPGFRWRVFDAAGGNGSEVTHGPLKSGIASLGPSSKRVLMWGQIASLNKWLGDGSVQVGASFRRKPLAFIDADEITSTSLLEVASFDGNDYMLDPAKESVGYLKNIVEVLKSRN